MVTKKATKKKTTKKVAAKKHQLVFFSDKDAAECDEQYPPWFEWGYRMHTALRKCCDSRITSIAYGIIKGMQGGEWTAFCECLYKCAKDGHLSVKDPKSFAASVKLSLEGRYPLRLKKGMSERDSWELTLDHSYSPNFPTSDLSYGMKVKCWNRDVDPSLPLYSSLMMCFGEFEEGELEAMFHYLWKD